MSIVSTREQRRILERENAKLPIALQLIPRHEWPERAQADKTRMRVWRSRKWLVQEYLEDAPAMVRLSINSTSMDGNRWKDGISWDDLQAIKNEVGYRGHDAIEIFPAEDDVVNVANMRHLWVMAEKIVFAWRNKTA